MEVTHLALESQQPGRAVQKVASVSGLAANLAPSIPAPDKQAHSVVAQCNVEAWNLGTSIKGNSLNP